LLINLSKYRKEKTDKQEVVEGIAMEGTSVEECAR
jgi:hypothetical protein